MAPRQPARRSLGDRLNRRLLKSRVYEWTWLRTLFVLWLRFVRAVAGDAAARRFLNGVGERLVWSGWPFKPGWVNLHASRFHARAERAVWGSPAQPVRAITRDPKRPLRIGMLANFHHTLGTQRPLFEGLPVDEVELHLFDRLAGATGAGYLAPLVASYQETPGDDPRPIAAAINRVAPDVFLNMLPKSLAYRLFEQLDTPCIAHVGTGSDLMHHPRVAFHLFTQPEFGYEARGGELWCGFDGRPFGAKVFESGLVCDARGLDRCARRTWREREPLVVWHGSLYKLCASVFIDVIFDLLDADPLLRFEYFGKGPQVAEITAAAARHGLGHRVLHRGVAGFSRSTGGELLPETFATLSDALARARFWPDSFPIGGGSARFEAYAAGVPSIHMAPTTDDASGPYEDGSLLELPWLRVEGSVAHSRAEYFDLGRQCLSSEVFAEQLVARQDALVRRVLDAPAWWRHVRSCYEEWERMARA